MNVIESLVTSFSKLPGIGKKSAARLAYHILETDSAFARTLAAQLNELHEAIKRCSVCGSWTETDPCSVCRDPNRDSSVLCVVARSQDVRVIEESREFCGRFHVLGGLIAPLDGVSPNDLAISALLKRVQDGSVHEIILALNPTIEGDTTSLYIQKIFSETGIKISRLAAGLPVGGDLEYADRLTLVHSLRGRIQM